MSGRPAAASCAPPVTVAENASRADAVVHGTVAGVNGRELSVRVARVLAGSVATTIRVRVGPDIGGGFGATSVDYKASPSTEHVLYLTVVSGDLYETNECNGTHPGAPTAEERVHFGEGTAPETSSESRLNALAILAAALAGVFVIVAARRGRRVR